MAETPLSPVVMTSASTEYREFEPHKRLKAYIACYWESRPLQTSGSAGESLVIPDGCSDILFDYDASKNSFHLTYCGIFGHHFAVPVPACSSNVTFGIRFLPGVSRLFIRESARHFTNQMYAMEDIDPLLARELLKIFTSSSDTKTLIQKLNDFFLKKIQKQPVLSLQDERIETILHHIVQTGGRLSVKEISRAHQLSTRTLQRLFDERVGLSPKKFSQVIRFQLLLSDFTRKRPSSLIDCDTALSFYDESHLYHELVKHTGKTPSQLTVSDFYKKG
ncbi:helix-turn-helix domain-containing protein [Bacillus marinisedimentorum]|uniref:helix-turn-helix domain-containing protein n=1 Tax=Bacillus marinisedimentorum TaxID=1821260 RepID=UPI000872B58E|nr:helix-turn-helix domain-containing protein [Bacillus marinisedimentorum]